MSTSSKRARIEVASQNSLVSALSQGTVSVTTRMVDNNTRVISMVERKKGKRYEQFTYTKLFNLLCPKHNLIRRGYGKHITGATNTGMLLVPNDANPNLQAAWNNVDIPAGRQGYISFVHLPYTDVPIRRWESGDPANMLATLINIQTTYTLLDLIRKSADAYNFNMQHTVIAGDTDPMSDKFFDRSFIYCGGQTKHTFVNTCNTRISFEITVSRPRRPYALNEMWANATASTSANTNQQVWPCQVALQDKNRAAPLSSNVAPLTDTQYNDQTSDLMFRIEAADKGYHYMYTQTKKTCTLGPGETLVFTVDHPSFQFTSSEWKTMMSSTYNANLATGKNVATILPNLLPFCTAFLDVRTCANLGHDETYTNVGRLPHTYIHTQVESHSFRHVPYTPIDSRQYIDDLNAVGGPNKHTNMETDAEVTFEN